MRGPTAQGSQITSVRARIASVHARARRARRPRIRLKCRAAVRGPSVARTRGMEPCLQPINGLSLERYADLGAAISDVMENKEKVAEIIAAEGVGLGDWEAAKAGWTTRTAAGRCS